MKKERKLTKLSYHHMYDIRILMWQTLFTNLQIRLMVIIQLLSPKSSII